VRFLMHTGARCGEACQLTLADVDRSADVWLFAPPRHKAAWRNKPRVIAIGPRGQEVLREFIRIRCPECGVEGRPPLIGSRDGALCGPCADRMDEQDICGPWQRFEGHAPDAPLFSPAAQREEIHAAMRARRQTAVQPSQACRKKAKAQRLPGLWFVVAAVDMAIRRACKKAAVGHWHPHQLRHLHGARARAAAGLDGAQAALGHATPLMTEHYSRLQAEKAAEVARRIG
jgi:integrase